MRSKVKAPRSFTFKLVAAEVQLAGGDLTTSYLGLTVLRGAHLAPPIPCTISEYRRELQPLNTLEQRILGRILLGTKVADIANEADIVLSASQVRRHLQVARSKLDALTNAHAARRVCQQAQLAIPFNRSLLQLPSCELVGLSLASHGWTAGRVSERLSLRAVERSTAGESEVRKGIRGAMNLLDAGNEAHAVSTGYKLGILRPEEELFAYVLAQPAGNSPLHWQKLA